MSIILKLPRQIDRLSEAAGSFGKWFAFLLVIIGTYETISRHSFNAPTIWAYDSLCMAGGVVYLLGASYTYMKDSHIRVDLLYSRLSPKGQAALNVVCALLFFFPLVGVLLKEAISWAIRAWRIDEVMFNSFWYPPAAPYRTLVAVGLLLLVLQGIARLIRDVNLLMGGRDLD
jgi:TRAP-type mannitol/chloroaromatic compound transport system permease small subunit